MRKAYIAMGLMVVAVAALAQTFTDLATPQYDGKTKIRKSHEVIDANFAIVEAGSGLKLTAPVALSVTNGQVITLAGSAYVLTGVGGANDATNTVTIANTTAGAEVKIMVASGSTNLVKLADSGNLKLSADAVLDNNDTLSLYAAATNELNEISRSNN